MNDIEKIMMVEDITKKYELNDGVTFLILSGVCLYKVVTSTEITWRNNYEKNR